MLLGAAFMLAVDTLCRTIAAIEVPPGVLTALIGTPVFLWLFAAVAQAPGDARPCDARSPSAFPAAPSAATSSFALAAGEVMCVLGPNGGGKTTLFRTVLGLLRAARRDASLLDETRSASLSRGEIARRVGYVPQGHAGYFAYTVREIVLMGRTAHLGVFSSPRQARPRGRRARARSARHRAISPSKPVTEISGGERQLALVARALAQEPKLLVLDEPTASLDFGNQVRVLETIAALARTGHLDPVLHATIPTTRSSPRIARCCSPKGRVLELGAPREVIRPDTLERCTTWMSR